MPSNFIFKQAIMLLLFIGSFLSYALAQEKPEHTDPVCKMKVTDERFTHKHDNKTYYFCSANCKQSFAAAPATYLSAQGTACVPAMPDYADSVNSGIIKQDNMKSSPRRTVCQSFGEDYMKIDYGAPGVKDRVIWGGLVAYDKVWAGGAHNATKLTLMGNAVFGQNNELLGGEYALFFIPGKDDYWTIIVNENFNQHLADDYDEQKDIFRIKIKAQKTKNATQRLTYEIVKPKNDNSGLLRLSWAHLSVEVPFKMMD